MSRRPGPLCAACTVSPLVLLLVQVMHSVGRRRDSPEMALLRSSRTVILTQIVWRLSALQGHVSPRRPWRAFGRTRGSSASLQTYVVTVFSP